MASGKSVMAVIRAARPTFRNKFDRIAFAVHASFLASGYVLTATGPQAVSDSALSNPSTDEVSVDHWNELDDEYAFVYANPEKGSKKVLVKCLVMNDKFLVDALAEGSSEPVHLVIDVGDYARDNKSSNYSDQFKNLDKLVNRLDKEVLSKLEGSSKSSLSSNPGSSSQSSEKGGRSRSGVNQPDTIFRKPAGPPIHPTGVIYPPINPSGFDDLHSGPVAGVYPMRGNRGTSGGMLVGPNDPCWFGGVGGEPGFPRGPPVGGELGFRRGQPGVPPGARFDPYGPPGIPGFEPNRFARNPRRHGQDTHPDLQHFRSDSDFI